MFIEAVHPESLRTHGKKHGLFAGADRALSGSGQNVGLSHVPGELKGLLWNITIIFKRYMC